MDYILFREHMRQLCESTGKPLREIAEGLKISAPTLSRYLTGDRLPEITYLVKVAEHFHVSLDWLVGLSGDKYELSMVPPTPMTSVLYRLFCKNTGWRKKLMMANNRVETTLHSDNLMGSLELLYPVPTRDHPKLSSLICIGQDLTVDCGFCCIEVSGIFLSSAGDLAFVLSRSYPALSVYHFISEMKTRSFDDLDSFASEFTYQVSGQAYRIIDLMAQRGYLSFSDAGKLSDEIDRNLSNEHFFVFCAGDRGDSVE